jgi:HEAT repeat protein
VGLFGPPNIEKMKTKRDIKGLIKALGYKKDNNVRLLAARTLGEIGDPQAVEPLLDCMWDERAIAATVMIALGKIRDKRTIEPLVQLIQREIEDERYLGSISQNNINIAIATLGRFGSDSVHYLISLFPNSKKYRSQIIKALSETGTEEAVDWLITAYDDWREYRQSIITALGKSGDQRVVEIMLLALTEKDFDLSSTAAYALDSLKWTPTDLEKVAYYYVAKREWSKAIEYGALAVEPLINVLWDDGNESNARKSAAQALGEIGVPSLDPLIRTISNGQYRYQPKARRLGMGNVWSHPDMRPRVLDYCVEALLLIGEKSVESLRPYLDDHSKHVHLVVAETLNIISKKNNKKK